MTLKKFYKSEVDFRYIGISLDDVMEISENLVNLIYK